MQLYSNSCFVGAGDCLGFNDSIGAGDSAGVGNGGEVSVVGGVGVRDTDEGCDSLQS